MSDSYKHSYIVGENLLNSPVGIQCRVSEVRSGVSVGTGSERSLLHPPYFLRKWFLYDRRKADPVKKRDTFILYPGVGSAVLCGPGEAVGIWLGRFYGDLMRHRS